MKTADGEDNEDSVPETADSDRFIGVGKCIILLIIQIVKKFINILYTNC